MRIFTVIVWFKGQDVPFIDGARGTDRETARKWAEWNWEGAIVSVMDKPTR